MKNKLTGFSIGLLLVVCIFTGCEEETPLAYQNDPAIYFNTPIPGSSIITDSVTISFMDFGGDSYTFWVQVITQGMISDADRTFSVRQIDKTETAPGYDLAKQGVNYLPFSDPEVTSNLFIPAGKATALFPVKLYRTNDMLEDGKKFVLDLELTPDDNFRLGMKNRLGFRIKFSGMPEKPSNWNTRWGPRCFGRSWGPVKHLFILDTCGTITWAEFPEDIQLVNYYNSLTVNALNAYNASIAPDYLKEKDGTPVTFSDK